MNNEEIINQFSQPPKKVRVKDVQVCIMEMQTATGTLCTFLFAYPYAEEEGGSLKVFNPSYKTPNEYERSLEVTNKTVLWQIYLRVRNKSLRDNPNLSILYEGKILRDEYYGTRKFK